MVEKCAECFVNIPEMQVVKYFRKDGKRICWGCNTLLNGFNEETRLEEKTNYQEKISFMGTISRLGKQRVICVPKTIQEEFNLDWKYRITLQKAEAEK